MFGCLQVDRKLHAMEVDRLIRGPGLLSADAREAAQSSGDVDIRAGKPGVALAGDGEEAPNLAGGAGGHIFVVGAAGGAALQGGLHPGAGSQVKLEAGAGGAAVNVAGGAGGEVLIHAGAGGSSQSAAGGPGGSVRVQAGAAGSAGGRGGHVFVAAGSSTGHTADGFIALQHPVFRYRKQGTIAAATVPAADLVNGILTWSAGASATVTLPSATAIGNAILGSVVTNAADWAQLKQLSFDFSVLNVSADAAVTLTLAGATNCRVTGSATVAAGKAGHFCLVFDSPDMSTYQVYRMA